MCVLFGTPLHVSPADQPRRIVGVQSDERHDSLVAGLGCRLRIQYRHAVVDAALLAVPYRRRRARRVKPDAALYLVVSRQRRKTAPDLQLVAARFRIFRNQVVVPDDLVQLVDLLAVLADISIEHRTAGEHVDRLGAPRTPYFETAHTLWESDAQVYLV